MHTLIVSVTLSLASLSGNQQAGASYTQNMAQVKSSDRPLTCQQYYDKDPHGSDPHGPDPHDEHHDSGLKANSMDTARTATDDVYGTDKYGVNSQHPLDNFPR